MKKTSYILALITAASALLLSSCTKEKAVGIAEGELVECTLQAEVAGTGAGLDIDTKVVLNADGVTPNWEEDDQILVLDADKKPVGTDGIFTLSSGTGTASGKFTGTVYIGQKPTYAIYPASAATVNDTEPAATAVTAGTLVASTGDDAGTIKGAVMLGSSSDGTTINFTNVCAVLKFNTGDYGKDDSTVPAIKSITVSASYGSTAIPVAGAFTINWEDLSIVKADSGTVDEFTVTLPYTNQGDNMDFLIPIFPIAKQGDTAPSMKYVFTSASDAIAEKAYNFHEAITAGTIKDLGVAYGLEFNAPIWMDLGFISPNGYPLYISRRNVASIDNGVAKFVSDESDPGMNVSSVPMGNIMSEDNLNCTFLN